MKKSLTGLCKWLPAKVQKGQAAPQSADEEKNPEAVQTREERRPPPEEGAQLGVTFLRHHGEQRKVVVAGHPAVDVCVEVLPMPLIVSTRDPLKDA